MSRSGYNEYDGDGDGWALIRWRGAVASAIRGKRGQAFLKELVESLDALPEPRLIPNALEEKGEFCALGSVGRARGMDMTSTQLALSAEIMYENDEAGPWGRDETPEERFQRVRSWAISLLRPETVIEETVEA
jgi:hypothetical protein